MQRQLTQDFYQYKVLENQRLAADDITFLLTQFAAENKEITQDTLRFEKAIVRKQEIDKAAADQVIESSIDGEEDYEGLEVKTPARTVGFKESIQQDDQHLDDCWVAESKKTKKKFIIVRMAIDTAEKEDGDLNLPYVGDVIQAVRKKFPKETILIPLKLGKRKHAVLLEVNTQEMIVHDWRSKFRSLFHKGPETAATENGLRYSYKTYDTQLNPHLCGYYAFTGILSILKHGDSSQLPNLTLTSQHIKSKKYFKEHWQSIIEKAINPLPPIVVAGRQAKVQVTHQEIIQLPLVDDPFINLTHRLLRDNGFEVKRNLEEGQVHHQDLARTLITKVKPFHEIIDSLDSYVITDLAPKKTAETFKNELLASHDQDFDTLVDEIISSHDKTRDAKIDELFKHIKNIILTKQWDLGWLGGESLLWPNRSIDSPKYTKVPKSLYQIYLILDSTLPLSRKLEVLNSTVKKARDRQNEHSWFNKRGGSTTDFLNKLAQLRIITAEPKPEVRRRLV